MVDLLLREVIEICNLYNYSYIHSFIHFHSVDPYKVK